MSLTDRIRVGLNDALDWASDKAEASAKLITETITGPKDGAAKPTDAAATAAAKAEQTKTTETPKPASLSTTIEGVNTSLTDKVAYAWQKTTEMTSALTTLAAVINPAAAAAASLVNIGNNTFKIVGTSDTVKVLDKKTSVTSVLSDSVWKTAIESGAGAAVKAFSDGKPVASIDTDKFIGELKAAQKDMLPGGPCGKRKIFDHVSKDEWKQILAETGDKKCLPEAAVDGDSITFSPTEGSRAKDATIAVSGDKAVRTAADGSRVEFDAAEQRFKAESAKGTTVEVNRKLGLAEVLDNGKGYREQDGKQVWDIAGGKTVQLKDGIFEVLDRSGNVMQRLEKDLVTDFRGKDRFHRFGGGRRIKEAVEHLPELLGAQAAGRQIGAAEDGIFMREKDGTTVVLQTDGNAYFQLPDKLKIWKDANDKYFIIEEGQAPKPILEGEEAKAIEERAAQYIKCLKDFAANKSFQHDGVRFVSENGTIKAEVDQGATTLSTDSTNSTLKTADGETSTLNLATNEIKLGDDAEQTTINLTNKTVETPWVKTDEKGTTIKRTGDWVGRNLEVKMADGTHFDERGEVHFSDGTTFQKDGTVLLGSSSKLTTEIQEQQIRQAAGVLSNAEAIADAVKAKAGSGLVTYAMISQLEGSISSINTLMTAFSGNDAIRARLGMVLASLEVARGQAQASFAANTTLRATREAALSNNNVKAETNFLAYNFSPELKREYRFGKMDRPAA